MWTTPDFFLFNEFFFSRVFCSRDEDVMEIILDESRIWTRSRAYVSIRIAWMARLSPAILQSRPVWSIRDKSKEYQQANRELNIVFRLINLLSRMPKNGQHVRKSLDGLLSLGKRTLLSETFVYFWLGWPNYNQEAWFTMLLPFVVQFIPNFLTFRLARFYRIRLDVE